MQSVVGDGNVPQCDILPRPNPADWTLQYGDHGQGPLPYSDAPTPTARRINHPLYAPSTRPGDECSDDTAETGLATPSREEGMDDWRRRLAQMQWQLYGVRSGGHAPAPMPFLVGQVVYVHHGKRRGKTGVVTYVHKCYLDVHVVEPNGSTNELGWGLPPRFAEHCRVDKRNVTLIKTLDENVTSFAPADEARRYAGSRETAVPKSEVMRHRVRMRRRPTSPQ